MEIIQNQLKKKIYSRFQKDTWVIRSLGEIAIEIYGGRNMAKNPLDSGDHPAIKCDDINRFHSIHFKECITFVDPNLIENPKYFGEGDVLVSGNGESYSTTGRAIAYVGKGRGILGNNVYAIRHRQNPKYLSYALNSNHCRRQIEELTQKGRVHHINIRDLKWVKVHIPPLEIQGEIVEILDKLTEPEVFSEEWKNRLSRKKQSNYYRELILEKAMDI